MKFGYCILSVLVTFTILAWSKSKAELIAYWPLDEVVDGKVLDATGNGYDGTVVGRLEPMEEANRKGLFFDGGANYIDCGSEGFDKINDEITISAWVKIEKFDKWLQAIAAKDGDLWQLQRGWGDSYHSINFNLKAENNRVIHSIGANGFTKVDDGKWHHIAGVYDGQNLKLYIDGMLNDSVARTKYKLSSLQNKFTIGENLLGGKSSADPKNSRSWHGSISDVAIFSRALTFPQLCLLYSADPLICEKYSHVSHMLSRSDIELLKSTPYEVFNEYVGCKKLFEERKYPEAIKALDKLIEDNVVSEQGIVIRASLLKYQIYIQQDDVQNALEVLEGLQKTYPDLDCPEVNFSLAYCYIKQGNNPQAQALLLRITDNHPQSVYALKAQLCMGRIKEK